MLAAQYKTIKPIHVLKFGGTSVKDVGRILHVADIIESRIGEGRLLVVLSAMGDTTDWLLNLARRCSSDPDERELDQLVSTGEQVSISLLSVVLRSRGIKTRSLTGAQAGILTDRIYTKARVLDIRIDSLCKALEKHDVVVVAGFQGITEDGDVTTLGRGGSDTSAAALAAACGAALCDIYTDVDGILTADPRVISDARLIEQICSEDALELARLGAQVIHPRAVALARNYGVPLRIRNTFKPAHVGTSIKGEEQMENYRAITGVAIDKSNAIICVSRLSGNAQTLPQILELLASHNIPVDLISQNLHTGDNISFTVPQSEVARTIKSLDSFNDEGRNIEVSFDPDATKVSLVGSGIATSVAIAARAFGVLGRANINVKLAATSDRRLTVVITSAQADEAAQLLHRAFELDKVTDSGRLQKTS